ncbi:hypothetical protein CLV95_10274 [Leptospira borgpetersenii serovar Javanica]|nr:hypothetical protein CLV95_10274 [Leptospira borgpetersenii serovar Javanica]
MQSRQVLTPINDNRDNAVISNSDFVEVSVFKSCSCFLAPNSRKIIRKQIQLKTLLGFELILTYLKCIKCDVQRTKSLWA